MSSLKKNLKPIILFFMLIISASLVYDLAYGDFSFEENGKIESLINKKEEELQIIASENEAFKEEINLLKNNNEYVEHIARENLGLIKEEEDYFDDEPE
jgi:cell division protein FtsB